MFGEELRKARKAKGLTLVQLGEIVGVSQSALSMLENGKTKPLRKTKIALAKALGTNFGEESLDEHLNGSERPPRTRKEILEETTVEELVTLNFGGVEKESKEDLLALARVLDKAIEEQDRIMSLPVRKSPSEKKAEEEAKKKEKGKK